MLKTLIPDSFMVCLVLDFMSMLEYPDLWLGGSKFFAPIFYLMEILSLYTTGRDKRVAFLFPALMELKK